MTASLLANLADELEALFDTALDQRAGAIEPPWAALLAQYRVTPVDDDAREDLLGRLDLVRGALPDEVAACGQVIVARFGALARDRRLAAAAAQVGDTIEGTYLRFATMRPSSMYALRMASTRRHESAQRPPSGIVHRCASCGGPRLVERPPCPFCAPG